MAVCPECEADIELDEYDVDKGEIISCPECGADLEVVGLSPLELDVAPQEEDDWEDCSQRVPGNDSRPDTAVVLAVPLNHTYGHGALDPAEKRLQSLHFFDASRSRGAVQRLASAPSWTPIGCERPTA